MQYARDRVLREGKKDYDSRLDRFGYPIMKIVAYNIHYAIGKDERYDLERVVTAVEGADIIALQEVRIINHCGLNSTSADLPIAHPSP